MSLSALLATICIAPSIQGGQDAPKPWTDEPQRSVGILVFDDVQIIDFTGPYEVFLSANAGGWHAYRVFTVAPSIEPITTVGGMTVVPGHGFDDHPGIDILVVPGGWGVWAQRQEERTLDWIRSTAEEAEIVFSICTGSFLLSKAGLLDGEAATTNSGAVERLREEAPTCRVLGDQRVVDSGKLVTSAGLTAGIDGSLHVLERTIGRGWAQVVSLGLEYDWRPESGYSAYGLAGRQVPPPVIYGAMGLPGTWAPVRHAGTVDRWESVAKVTSTQTDQEVHDAVSGLLVQHLRWVRQGAEAPATGVASAWTFDGRDGKPWSGRLFATPVEGQPQTRTVRIEIERLAADDEG